MTSIFEPAVLEDYEWAMPVLEDSFEVLGTLGQKPISADWRPLEFYVLRQERGRSFQRSDCPWLASHALVMRERALKAFTPLLGSDAEALPLNCQTDALSLLHVYTHLDALDEEKSRLVRFPSSGRIMTIQNPVFRPAALVGHHFFKLSAQPRGPLYVSEDVVVAARDAELEGVEFKRVWGG